MTQQTYELQKAAYHFWNLERGLAYPAVRIATNRKKIVFFFEDGWEPQAAEIELLSKIAAAVGFSDFELKNAKDEKEEDSKLRIYLVEKPSGKVESVYHPRLLLQRPELKKDVWDKLKKRFLTSSV